MSHTFDSTDLAFRLATCSVTQISRKSRLLVCEFCRKHLSAASTPHESARKVYTSC